MTSIVQKDTEEGKVLRDKAAEVPSSLFQTEELKNILHDMRTALESQNDGVALAAPQIGVSKRIFVVSPKIFAEDVENMKLTFINPEIIKKSKDKKLVDEGCLSVRWWYGKIERSSKVTIKALDEDGNEFQMEGSGLLAQIFQHETDHLNGILFVDNATELFELDKDKINE